MTAWVIKLHRFWAGRRVGLGVASLAVMSLSAILAFHLRPDQSLALLLPDNSPELRRVAGLLDLAPFARVLLVQLTAADPSAAWALGPAAEDLARGLDPNLLTLWLDPETLPEPESLLALLPALCDGGCRARLAAGLAPDRLQARLAELKKNLAALGGEEEIFWRADPLRWRGEVFSRLPRPRTEFMADFLTGYPVSRDGRHLLLVLKPQVSMNEAAGSRAALAHLESLLRGLPPGLDAQVVGALRHTAANAEAIQGDLALTLPLAMGLLLLLYLTLVRSWGAVWLFLTPAAALLLASAALTALPSVSGLALGFGAAVLGIAEDYAVYVHFALRRAPDPETALGRAVRPMFLSVVLCGTGFAVLMLAGVPAIRHLALFSALSLAAGFTWAVIVLPHCPGMDMPREFVPVSEAAGGTLRPGWTVGLGLALAAGIALASVRLPLDFSLRDLNLASPALLADQTAVAGVWGGDQDRRIFLAQGRTPAEALALAGEVAADLGGRGGTGLSTLAGLCPPPAGQAENLRGWTEFTTALGEGFRAEFRRAAASAGFTPSAFDPFLDWLRAPPLAVDPERLAGLGWAFLTDYYMAARDGYYYALVEMDAPGPPLAPGFRGRVFPLSARDLEEALSRGLLDSSRLLPLAAGLACLAVLLAAFKNKAEALAAFLPALAGLAAVLAVNLLRGRALGLVEAAALPLLIGLGADYGLVAVSEARQKGSLGAGRAIMVSGLSTLAGVGLLVLARHPVLRALGETVSVGLLAAMPVAVLGLPRLYRAGSEGRVS